MSLEDQIKTSAEKAVLHFITSGGWMQPDYQSRVKLPSGFINEVWALVDTQKIKAALATRIEAELADRVMNHLAAEMATDVKQILSNTERREALRAVARAHMDAICNPKA